MDNFKLSSPVILIVFNRPETTERVFAEIAKAKPAKLFVVGDGPRKNRADDIEKVAATRAIIQKVDWECQLFTKFSDENLGCKMGPATGLDWVFEQVEEAIILEDDCLPDQTFFRFCQEMLERYRSDLRISMITGDNFQFGNRRNSDSYFFSKYCLCWGWATWRDRWNSYDVTISKWPQIRDEGWLADMLGNEQEVGYWHSIFESVHKREIDTAWDYQWVFTNLLEGRLCVTPSVNLISNIGAGKDATHTKNENSESMVLNTLKSSITFPLIHPIGVFKNIQADKKTYWSYFDRGLLRRIRNKIVRVRNKYIGRYV